MPWEPLRTNDGEPPKPVGGALDRLLRGMGTAPAAKMTSVFERWTEIVGDGLAGHATPVSLKGGALVISVPDPAWATQLRFLEQELLARLADALGPDEVRSIEVRVRAAGRPPRR